MSRFCLLLGAFCLLLGAFLCWTVTLAFIVTEAGWRGGLVLTADMLAAFGLGRSVSLGLLEGTPQ